MGKRSEIEELQRRVMIEDIPTSDLRLLVALFEWQQGKTISFKFKDIVEANQFKVIGE
jgi:hypothetical protein